MMTVHKRNQKGGGAICNSKDYQSSIISHHWLQVNCKKCKLMHKLKPKLENIINKIKFHQEQINHLTNIERKYVKQIQTCEFGESPATVFFPSGRQEKIIIKTPQVPLTIKKHKPKGRMNDETGCQAV